MENLVECWWDRERERREEGVAEWRQREIESQSRGGESVVCATKAEEGIADREIGTPG